MAQYPDYDLVVAVMAKSSAGDSEAWTVAEEFLTALAAQHAASTCRSYRYDIAEFLSWCQAAGIAPLEPSAEQVDAYAAHLREAVPSRTVGPPLPAVRRKLTALAGLFEHAVQRGYAPASPISRRSWPRTGAAPDRTDLTSDDLENLLAAARARDPRSHALVALLAGTGLRVGEALARDVEDVVAPQRGQVVLRFHRNARTGVVDVPVPAAVWEILESYLSGRRSGPLFITKTGRRLDQPSVWRVIRRCARDADLASKDEINPHSLREYFIAASLESGASPEQVEADAGYTQSRSMRRHLKDPDTLRQG